jgi:hypothetical protein
MRLPRGMDLMPWQQPKQMFRGILSDEQIQILARAVWPLFRNNRTIDYSKFYDQMVSWGQQAGLQFDPDSVVGWWVEQGCLEVSPDRTQFRFTNLALSVLDQWLEEDRLWNSGEDKPMPLVKRLVAGETFRNLRKIQELIGSSTVTGIHDPYTNAGALTTIHKLADMGTQFDKRLRLLGTPQGVKNATEKKSLVALLNDLNTERNTRWEIRTYTDTSRPHRRFLVLNDGAVVTCGMSLNHINKDEVLDREECGSQYAQHDLGFFEENWNKATVVS